MVFCFGSSIGDSEMKGHPVPKLVALMAKLSNSKATQARVARTIRYYRMSRDTWQMDWENELRNFRRVVIFCFQRRHNES